MVCFSPFVLHESVKERAGFLDVFLHIFVYEESVGVLREVGYFSRRAFGRSPVGDLNFW